MRRPTHFFGPAFGVDQLLFSFWALRYIFSCGRVLSMVGKYKYSISSLKGNWRLGQLVLCAILKKKKLVLCACAWTVRFVQSSMFHCLDISRQATPWFLLHFTLKVLKDALYSWRDQAAAYKMEQIPLVCFLFSRRLASKNCPQGLGAFTANANHAFECFFSSPLQGLDSYRRRIFLPLWYCRNIDKC